MESNQPASVGDEQSGSPRSDPSTSPTTVWSPRTVTRPSLPFSQSFSPTFNDSPYLTHSTTTGFTPVPIFNASLSATSSAESLQPVMTSYASNSQLSSLLYGSATPTTNPFPLACQYYTPVTNTATPSLLPPISSQSHPSLLTRGHVDYKSLEIELVDACRSGDDSLVLYLINCGVNVDCLGIDLFGELSPLMMASALGRKSIVELLLERGAQVDLQNRHGRSALMCASRIQEMDIVKLLIDHGAKVGLDHALVAACRSGDDSLALSLINSGVNVNHLVDVLGESGDEEKWIFTEWSSLMVMIRRGKISMVKLLLERGAMVDLKTKVGKTPLMVASYYKQIEILKLLIDRGAKVGLDHALVAACRSGDDSLALSLINSGVNVDCLVEVDASDDEEFIFIEWSLLMVMIRWGKISMVKLLLEHGAQVDLKTTDGYTALMVASYYKQIEILKLLIDRGANVGLDSALVAACKSGDVSLALSLINSGVNVNCFDFLEEFSPLMGACAEGHTSVVKFLLNHGAQIDLQTIGGESALTWASSCGQMDIAKLLLECGAKVELESALFTACRVGDDSLVLSLINSGVNVNCLEMGDISPLMMACIEGHTSIIKLLLNHGAHVNLQNAIRSTALIKAIERGKKHALVEITKILLEHGAEPLELNLLGRSALVAAKIQNSQEIVDLLISALMPRLTNMLHQVAHKWRELGKHLGLNQITLSQCHSSAEGKYGRLKAVMNTWLQQNESHPSWRTLYEAVNMVDTDLAQEINDLVGFSFEAEENEEGDGSEAKDEAQHLAAVEKAIREKGELEHTVAHCALVGPAGSGKSSLLSRLSGEMPSPTSSSTGVAERLVQVEVKRSSSITVSADSAIWCKILYNDEAIQVMNFASCVPSSHPPAFADMPHLLPAPPTTTNMDREPAASTPTVLAPVANSPSTSASFYTHKPRACTPLGYVPPKGVFRRALQGRQLKHLCQRFKNSWTLYLTDTGGQMEFQEVLPLLVSGPSIFLITFRLNQDLHQRFTIEYRLPDGGTSEPYQSTLTVVEAILQTLASVASMGTFTYSGSQTRSSPLKPKVLIVGTHKDQLDPSTADSKIKEIDEYLQKVIRSTAHYDKDLVVFSCESQLIFTVNNFSEDDSDFKKIQSSVDQAVCRGEFKMRYPAHWLIFSLVLRQQMIKDRIISYEQCFAVAQDCGIASHEELNHALWFLHTKIGLVRHFPTPGLDDIVIRDPQVLFDHVTHLIVDSFSFKNVGKRLSCEFKQKGIFSFEDLERVSQFESILTPDKLLELLKFLRIVVPFLTEDGILKYFIPCVLTHSKVCDSQKPRSQQCSGTPPLLITFKCGYCPKGLAGALIVYLLSNEMGSKFKWELQTDRIFRDQISFLVSPYDIITLLIHPTYLELAHCREDSSSTKPVQSVCSSVRQNVEKALRKVSSDMKLTSDANHSLSFHCENPQCTQSNGSHPATQIKRDEDCPSNVVNENGQCKLWCKRSGQYLSSSVPHGCSLWFGSVKEQDSGGCHDNTPAPLPTRKRVLAATCTVSEELELTPSPSQRRRISESDSQTSNTDNLPSTRKRRPAKSEELELTPSPSKRQRISVLDSQTSNSDKQTSKDDIEQPRYTENDMSAIIMKHKSKPAKFDTKELKENVKLILLTCNEYEKWAVFEKLLPPSLDSKKPPLETALYIPQDNIVIGTFAGYTVVVLTTQQGKRSEKELKKSLDTFPNAQAIIGVGVGYGKKRESIKLADVMISDHIENASQVSMSEGHKVGQCGGRIPIKNELLRYFKNKTSEWQLVNKFTVSKEGRSSQAKVGTIVSCETLMGSGRLTEQYMGLMAQTVGGEMEGCSLLNMIEWMEQEHRLLSVIVIKGVAGYGDKQDYKNWQLTAAKAAVNFVHYCLQQTEGMGQFLPVGNDKRVL